VRSAAARTLAKLERWQELALSFYVDVRPFFVDTAKMLSEKFDPPTARTFLWRNLENARLGSLQRIRQEDIETAYVDLYAFNLSAYDRFRSTIDKLKEEDERLYRRFVEKTQAEVLALEGTDPAFYEPTALGNTLRATCEHFSSVLDRSIVSQITPLREFLAEIIAMDDQELLRYRD
jgi:hypothetical protein